MNTQSLKIKNPKSQKGSVIFYVLIAVTLLAALAYAVSHTMRGSTEQLNGEKAQLYATELLEYAGIVASATAQLRLRGCSDTEISFQHTNVTGYTNGSAPGDSSCHVFNINGGGVERISIPSEVTDSSASPDYIWQIYEGNELENVGQTDGDGDSVDLILTADALQLLVCTKINDLLGVSNPGGAPPQDTNITTNKFTGSYANVTVLGDEDTALLSRTAACFENTTTSKYMFYKVLIAR